MHRLHTLIALTLVVMGLSAQTLIETTTSASDLQLRAGIQLKKTWRKTFCLEWEEEARMKYYITNFDRLHSTLAFTYNPIQYFNAKLGYTFILINHDGKKSTNYVKYWDMRHRLYTDFKASYSFNDWKLSLRERPLVTIRTDSINSAEKARYEWNLRSQLMVEYKWFGKPLKPYLSIEVSNTLNAPELANGNYIDNVRTTLGIKYKINTHHSFNFFYRFDADYNRDINIKKNGNVNLIHEQEFNHIIGVFYNINL